MKVIDAYCHIIPLAYVDSLRRYRNETVGAAVQRQDRLNKNFPQFCDLDHRFQNMDEYGIDAEVASPVAYLDPNLLPLPKQNLSLTRLLNDSMAQIARESNGRIWAVGAVPLLSSKDDIHEELRRAKTELGLKGVNVPTNVHGRAIDTFGDLWESAAELRMPVYLHPANSPPAGRTYEKEYDLMHVLGWPFDTSLALSRLVFSGIAKKYPQLPVIAHHLGGMIPFFGGRMVESYQDKGLLRSFKRFYYDVAVGGSEAAFMCGYNVFGSKRLILGTDYPHGPNGGKPRLAGYPRIVKESSLSEKEKADILEGNIRRILRL